MTQIKAIAFDLVNTLITLDYRIIGSAMSALIQSLEQDGFNIDEQTFRNTYMAEAMKCFKKAHNDGIEIHNSQWISTTLKVLGFDVPPEDQRIARGVDAYFNTFYPGVAVIPGTIAMLAELKKQYSIGLLSNFTHAPFIRNLLKQVTLEGFFDVILISDELGFRKPHPRVFQALVDLLEKKEKEIVYVGDDLKADIQGAGEAGLYPVWTTIVKDQNLQSVASNLFSDTEEPGKDIPRISTWQDLFRLLDEF